MFGLLPQKRGPQGGHKLTTEVTEFVAGQLSADPSLTPGQLAGAIQKRFRFRPIRGAFSGACCAKKTTLKPPFTGGSSGALRSSYEDLRAQVLSGGRGPGIALFLRHGMCEWMEVCRPRAAVVAATEPAAAIANNPQLLPPGMRSEIVALLAGMVLEKQWEVTR